MTAWPNPNDYVEALQNPQLAFNDPALRFGTVILDRLGLPRPISGNFAIVFEIVDGMSAPRESERKRWAVRCFARETTGQEARYAAIARHLSRHPLPFMVGFEYLPRGIRVRGQWYPIVKMEWVRGERIDTFIESQLNQPATLQRLAGAWAGVVRSLANAQIAHGDLQHGNVVIANGDIRLIDYDGMIVPELAGAPGGEIGHRHYQHPSRTSDIGVNGLNFTHVDNFSAWIIWASLIAAGIDPSLWTRTGAGDDRLLFTEKDFKRPDASLALGLLIRHRDPRLQEVGRRLNQVFKSLTYLDVPPLDDSGVLTPRAPLGATWLQDYGVNGQQPPAANMPPALAPAPRTNGGWVEDHTRGTRPSHDTQPLPVIESPIPSMPAPTAAQPMTPPELRSTGEVARPPVRTTGMVDFPQDWVEMERERLRNLYNNLNFLQRAVYLGNLNWYYETSVRAQWERYPLVIERRRAEAIADQARRMRDAAAGDYAAAVRNRDTTRAQFEEARNQLRDTLIQIDDAITNLKLSEQAEEAAAVADARRAFVEVELRNKYPLQPRMIRGIGKSRIEALQQSGISTLADITPANKLRAILALTPVRGVDPEADWALLEAARLKTERLIPFHMPPDAPEVVAIRHAYAIDRAALEDQRQAALSRLEALNAVEMGAGTGTVEEDLFPLARMEAAVQRARAAYDAAASAALDAEREAGRYGAITRANLIRKMRE